MPSGSVTSVCRNTSSTPYEKAAARVPPPENVRMIRPSGVRAICGRLVSRYPAWGFVAVMGGLTGRVAQPASSRMGAISNSSA